MPTLADITKEMGEISTAVQGYFKDAGDDMSNLNVTAEEVAKIRDLNARLTVLGKEREGLQEAKAAVEAARAEMARQHEADTGVPLPKATEGKNGLTAKDGRSAITQKTLGDMFVESQAYLGYQKSMRRGPVAELEISDMLNGYGTGLGPTQGSKATLLTSDWPFLATRQAGFLDYALRRPMIADLIPQAQTDSASISYVEEQAPVNGADFVEEGEPKPESAITFIEKLAGIGKIATILPVTDEMLADLPQIRGYVEQRLRTFIQLREEDALVSGSGVSPEFTGILNVPGILTQAKGADPAPDAVYKAMVKIQITSYLDPTGLIMNPLDWQDIALLRTADGIYIWGGPAQAGPERIWGLTVVKTQAVPQNTAIVAAFDTAMQIFRREGISLAVSDSHLDFFARNQLAIRAEERLGFVVYRPTAICTITGI